MIVGPKIATDQLVFAIDSDSAISYDMDLILARNIVNGKANTNGSLYWTRDAEGFDFGGDAGMTFDSTFQLQDNFSMEVFFRPSTNSQDNFAGLIAKDSDGSFGSGVMCMAQNDGYIRFGFNPGTGNEEVFNVNYTDMEDVSGAWFHYIGTYDGTTMKLYRNGVEIDSEPVTGQGASQDAGIVVGSRTIGNQYSYEGHIKFARIYKKGLTAAEVALNYKYSQTRI